MGEVKSTQRPSDSLSQ